MYLMYACMYVWEFCPMYDDIHSFPSSKHTGIEDDAAVNNIVEMLKKQGMNFDVFGKVI